ERLRVLRQRWAPYLSDCLKQETRMFIAMNRFRVKKGSEEAFEKVWLSRRCDRIGTEAVWPLELGDRGRAPLDAQGCGPEQAALHRPSAIRRLRGPPNRIRRTPL